MFDLTGKTALVTGASGGLGAEIARVFHKAGATVAISGRKLEVLDALAKELGDRVHVVPCDLADRTSVAKLIDEAVKALGGRLELHSDASAGTRIDAQLPRDVGLVVP